MCGICGIVTFDRQHSVSASRLAEMNRQIVHRGVAGAAEERLVLRIDRVDGTGEADAVQALDDHPAR